MSINRLQRPRLSATDWRECDANARGARARAPDCSTWSSVKVPPARGHHLRQWFRPALPLCGPKPCAHGGCGGSQRPLPNKRTASARPPMKAVHQSCRFATASTAGTSSVHRMQGDGYALYGGSSASNRLGHTSATTPERCRRWLGHLNIQHTVRYTDDASR